jgi:hypothetical protein
MQRRFLVHGSMIVENGDINSLPGEFKRACGLDRLADVRASLAKSKDPFLKVGILSSDKHA